MNIDKKKLLVIGATGFVGRRFCQQLIDQNYQDRFDITFTARNEKKFNSLFPDYLSHSIRFETLDNYDKKMCEIISELPKTFQSPTMAPYCKDTEKYKVVEELTKQIENIKNLKVKIDDQEIKDILTVNGIRFSFDDGSWGLIRASSNKPSLVVVTESPTSDSRKIKIFKFIDDLLQKTGKIGEYDQKI